MKDVIKRTCLVLMPFDIKYNEIYELVYKQVCKQFDLQCYRIDEISKPGSITKDIVDGIINADIIIADLTSKNPNVFYELGIAHTIGNKTIMTCQKDERLPFDISNYRVLFYEQTIQGAKQLSEMLGKTINELLVSLDQTNNPVQEVISRRSTLVLRHKMPIIKLVNQRDLNRHIVSMFKSEGIINTDDLKRLNLQDIKDKYDLGKASLEKLVKLMLDHDLYEDSEKIQDFVLKYKLSTAKTYKQLSRGY